MDQLYDFVFGKRLGCRPRLLSRLSPPFFKRRNCTAALLASIHQLFHILLRHKKRGCTSVARD